MSATLAAGPLREATPAARRDGPAWLLGSTLLHAAALAAVLTLAKPRPALVPEQAVTLMWERQEEGAADAEDSAPALATPTLPVPPPGAANPAPVIPPVLPPLPPAPTALASPPAVTAQAVPPAGAPSPPLPAVALPQAPAIIGPAPPAPDPAAVPSPSIPAAPAISELPRVSPPPSPQPQPPAARPPAPAVAAAPPRPRPAAPPSPAPTMQAAPAEAVWSPTPPPLATGGGLALGAIAPARPLGGGANAPPEYPQGSRARGEQGRVSLVVRVDADGRVLDATVVGSSGFPALDESAERAVRRWRFQPAAQDGRPVASTVPVDIRFQLEGTRRW